MPRCARVLLLAVLLTETTAGGLPAQGDTPASSAAPQRATPSTTLAPLQQAFQHYRTGRYDLAIRVLEAEVRFGSLQGRERVQGRELLARCYVRARSTDDAVRTFLVMLYQDPSYRPGLQVVGDEHDAFIAAHRRYMTESRPPAPPTDRGTSSESTDRSALPVLPPPRPSSPPPPLPPQSPSPSAARDMVGSAPLALQPAVTSPPQNAGRQPPPMPVTYRRSNAWMLWATGFVLAAVGTALYVDGVGRE